MRVLVDLDLVEEFNYKILVERFGFAFFVEIMHEKVPKFCHYCTCIEHSYGNCRRKEIQMDNNIGKVSSKVTKGTK